MASRPTRPRGHRQGAGARPPLRLIHGLPRSSPWEIDLIRLPGISVAEIDLEGILAVADHDSGQPRCAVPIEAGQDLLEPLRRALLPEAPDVPSRPEHILCRGALQPRLRAFAAELGVPLRIVEELPAIARLEQDLRESLAEGPPLLPAQPELWRPVIAELVAQAPWVHLSDSVGFQFPQEPAPLDDALALVLGQAGEQRGLVIYETTVDYEAFLAVGLVGLGALGEQFLCWCVHLDPADELPPTHAALAAELGLVFDGLVLQVFALEGSIARPLLSWEEDVCLRALVGVLGAWKVHGAALEDEPHLTRVDTDQGEIVVQSLSADEVLLDLDEPDLLTEAPHRLDFEVISRADGAQTPVMTWKAAKADAQRLNTLLAGIDAISLEPAPGGVYVVGWAGERRIGTLSKTTDAPQIWAPWREEGRGMLVIAGGGATRRGVRDKDVLSRRPVELLDGISGLLELLEATDPGAGPP